MKSVIKLDHWQIQSGAFLALATLTKGLPALLLVALWPLWRWRAWVAYVLLGWGLALPYLIGPGFGLAGERDGTGLFGAIRIYSYQWNYNGGIYHWLEVWLTGVRTEGAVPPGTPGVATAKLVSAAILGVVLLLTAWAVWKWDADSRRLAQNKSAFIRVHPRPIQWLRLAWVPFAAHLLLTPAVHPWYVILLVPGCAIWLARHENEPRRVDGWTLAGYAFLFWTWSVGLSYLTYVDPANLREMDAVRLAEYLPVYGLLLGGAVAALAHAIISWRSPFRPPRVAP